MSERTPIVVRLVTDDIHADVEYELNLDAGTLSAEAAQPPMAGVLGLLGQQRPADRVRRYGPKDRVDLGDRQAMVDAFRAAGEIVEEAN